MSCNNKQNKTLVDLDGIHRATQIHIDAVRGCAILNVEHPGAVFRNTHHPGQLRKILEKGAALLKKNHPESQIC